EVGPDVGIAGVVRRQPALAEPARVSEIDAEGRAEIGAVRGAVAVDGVAADPIVESVDRAVLHEHAGPLVERDDVALAGPEASDLVVLPLDEDADILRSEVDGSGHVRADPVVEDGL